MSKKYRFLILALLAAVALAALALFIFNSNIAVLNPKGQIASRERDLINLATFLMLIIVIPVFVLTFLIAWKYRAGNKKAKYSPDWDHNRLVELTWWAIPSAIILVLAVVAWKSSHELDPFKPIEAAAKPITVQVVALQWKWLFIYPEQNIASVNYLQIPEDTPIIFEITADAPMNSLWIPQLGGQVYAMAGMKTKLHLIADEPGDYRGSSANISGEGFSSMRFIARASSLADFEEWVETVKRSANTLSLETYNKLASPSRDIEPTYYSSTESGLQAKIIMKFTMPEAAREGRDQYGGSYKFGGHH